MTAGLMLWGCELGVPARIIPVLLNEAGPGTSAPAGRPALVRLEKW
jgi:hypothetical protein